jgi:Amt family ammonium transporter
MLLTGVFATKTVNPEGVDGLLYGNPEFFFTQLKALLIVVVFSFTMSFIIFKFINLIQPIRVSSEDEEEGLDATQHNEKYSQGTLIVSNKGDVYETETENDMENDLGKLNQIAFKAES